MRRVGVGLQTWTIRRELRVDLADTLRKVAAMGYEGIEFARLEGLSPSAAKPVLDDLGLKVVGTHVPLEALDTCLEREVELSLAAGSHDLVCPGMPEALHGEEEQYRRAARTLNEAGRRCGELGARLSFHNHATELERFGDSTGLGILLDETDPELVGWEIDTGWLAYAQQDPVVWMRRYGERCYLLHLRDMTAGPNPADAEFGEGAVDFEAILKAANSAEWHIVELDKHPRPIMQSVATSLRRLREWIGSSGERSGDDSTPR